MWSGAFPTSTSGAKFLGKTTPLAANAANTPTITFGPGYEWIIVYYVVMGYTGGGGIARLQLGTTSTIDTGTNYSMITARFVAGGTTVGTTTSRVSQAGVEVGNTTTTSGRRGRAMIWNPTADPKFMEIQTITYSAQNPTAATVAHASYDSNAGNWWNNNEAQAVRMDAGSQGVQILTGSFISVYGLPR